MSDALTWIGQTWPWLAPAGAIAAGLWRWWSGRGRPAPPRRYKPEPTEAVLFPNDKSSPSPGRGLARWLSAPVRLALKEAGEQAVEEEIAGLRADLAGSQADNNRLRADNTRLRKELDSLIASGAGSTAMDGARSRPLRPRRPRSSRSGD